MSREGVFRMLTVNAMNDIDTKMMNLAVHGVAAPSQISREVGGLAGATDEGGTLTPMLAPLEGISDLLAEYADARTNFEAGLGAALDDAEEASSTLRAPDTEETHREESAVNEKAAQRNDEISEAATNAAPSAPPANLEAQVVAAENERAAIGRFEAFVNRYNEVTRFLKENQDVSERVASLATMFSNSSKEMGSLSAIGIVADESGTLRVNAEQVKASLRAQSSGAESAKETERLTERAEKNIRLASFNQKRLFPSVSSVIGHRDNAEKSMYSARASAARDDFGSRGVIFNLYH